jgi:hypothetical protein
MLTKEGEFTPEGSIRLWKRNVILMTGHFIRCGWNLKDPAGIQYIE